MLFSKHVTEITELDSWLSLTIPDVSNRAMGEALGKLGWDRKGAAAAVALRLSPDNSKPEGAQLVLQGAWNPAIKLQAKKVFPEAEDSIVMKVEINNMGVFRCKDNEMCGYIPQAAVKVQYTKEEEEIEKEDLARHGIQEVTFRAVTHLTKDCRAKYGIWLGVTLLVFPLNDEAMSRLAEDTANPAWQGVRLTDGQIPVLSAAGPRQAAARGKDWGTPTAPLVVPGAHWEAAPGPPAEKEIADSIGQFLNSGVLAEAAVSMEGIKRKWETLMENPGQISRR